MPIKHTDFIIKGMHRDLSESVFNPEFAYENQNIRITADRNDSSEHTGDMYALTNERGNKYTPVIGLEGQNMDGIPIGQCTINNQWVVFYTEKPEKIEFDESVIEASVSNGNNVYLAGDEQSIGNLIKKSKDKIYRLWMNDDELHGELLYEGKLGFDYTHPIEALGYYENENIQKVYWTDGLNQPRFINITEKEEKKAKWNDNSFDFVAPIDMTNTTVAIVERPTGGMFPAGVIQWFFTYSRQFGQETAIFASTGLYELKHEDRGAAPDEMTSQSFKIYLDELDDSFEYVNIYSLIRTSLDYTPIAKLVGTIPIVHRIGRTTRLVYDGNGNAYPIIETVSVPCITAEDTNMNGTAIDPQELLYKGGEMITAYTMEQKDNTLFLGNYKLMQSYIPQPVRDELKSNATFLFKFLSPDSDLFDIDDTSRPFFKCKNTYRIGIQFQHKSGKWSEAVWLGDFICDKRAALKYYNDGSENRGWALPYGSMTFGGTLKSAISYIVALGYVKARPLVVYPNATERAVVAQGVLSTTMQFTANEDYYYPDYFFRHITKDKIKERGITADTRKWYNKQCVWTPFYKERRVSGTDNNGNLTYKEDEHTPCEFVMDEYCHAVTKSEMGIGDKWDGNHLKPSADYFDFYSPDIEFNDDYKVLYNNKDFRLSIVENINNILPVKVQHEITTSSISKPTVGHNAWYDPSYVSKVKSYWQEMKDDDGFNIVTATHAVSDSVGASTEYTGGWFNTFMNGVQYSYGRTTNMDESDLFWSDAIYPRRIPDTFKIDRQHNYHFVGGYLWEDTFQNVMTRHSELLGKDVPNGASAFMQYYWQWIFPIFLWQASGSICYDPDENPSSALKSNKTLHFFKCGSFREDATSVNGSVTVKATSVYGEDTVKLSNDNDALLYSQRVENTLVWNEDYSAVLRFKYDNQFYWSDDWLADRRYHQDTPLDAEGFIYHPVSYNDFKDLPYDVYNLPEQGGIYSPGPFRRNFQWHNIFSNEVDKTARVLKRSAEVKYKSTPHFVLSNGEGIFSMWDGGERGKGILIGELEQDVPDELFGGDTDSVIQSNSFLVAGEAVSMTDKDDVPITEYGNFEVRWTVGDCRLQYYECLKTYPVSFEDENCVTEVLKIPMETYCNLDGRYDTWKGNPTFATSPANWNLMNPVYNQKDNFFVYHGLDLSTNSIDSFPNSFTWTLTKWAGDTTDKWTHVNMASNMDVDGSKGGITKLIKLQDNLLCFQPRGLSQILYNEREQIATGSGLPVELANSGKVNGVRYISDYTGCNNKWSICKADSALYWVDDENKAIMALGQQVDNLSDRLGFHSWINAKSELKIWNPVDFDSFVTYYDPYNRSVMFFYDDNMLSYNTQLNCFDSFFSYGHVPYYNAFNGTAFTLSDKDSDGKGTYKAWEQHKGNYNYFYVKDVCEYDSDGNVVVRGRYDKNGLPTNYGYEQYYATLIVNPDMPYDKVFTNIDMMTDMWNNNNELLEETFSHIEVWNEFQWNKSTLIRNVDIPKVHMPAKRSILKKKFRTWYIDIPRDIKNPDKRYYKRDRMRNSWIYLKLSKELIDNDSATTYPYISDNKHIIHHIGVSYFI